MHEWTRAEIALLVAAAERAPLFGRAHPWVFETGVQTVLVFEQLPMLPLRHGTGRTRLLACGAATTNLEVALRMLGWEVRRTLFPDRTRPDETVQLWAVRPVPPTALDSALYQAIGHARAIVGDTRFGFDSRLDTARVVPSADGHEFQVVTPGDGSRDRVLAGAALQRLMLRAGAAGYLATLLDQPARRVRAGHCQGAVRIERAPGDDERSDHERSDHQGVPDQ